MILKVPKEFPNYPNSHDFDDHDTFTGMTHFSKTFFGITKTKNN